MNHLLDGGLGDVEGLDWRLTGPGLITVVGQVVILENVCRVIAPCGDADTAKIGRSTVLSLLVFLVLDVWLGKKHYREAGQSNQD